ncbi:MAG: PmoA family protein [Candidatus Poribacteria bacterium]|nr:PmoA family protein [Candidatus Poribacteria bacterium]
MQFFSIEDDAISLPRGAWAKSHRLNVRWRGKSITSLSQGQYRAYLFPVYTPAGFAVTTESPVDHPHHNSLWIAADHFHCRLPFATEAYEEATYNFYVNETFQGRAPGRIISASVESTEMSEDHLRMIQTLNWQGPPEWGAPQGRTLAVEARTIDIYPGEVANVIDMRSQLRPTDWDISIGPTRHAYFGVRMAEALRATDGATLTDSENRTGASAITGQVADWVDCSGVVAAGRRAGVAVFPHPLASKAPWFVADWGTLSVNPFGQNRKAIRQNDVLDFAVRVVVHDEDVEGAGIAERYRAFRQELDRS